MRFLVLLAFVAALRAAPEEVAVWGPLQPLVGNWIGEGGGGPGQGSGSFSFQPDLRGKILVRKNRAAYPAQGDRPASVHDDLMIVYRNPVPAGLRAMYFDSEGHLIKYDVEAALGQRGAVFLSEAQEGEPRYRLTYTLVDRDHVKITFEIASPGRPGEFAKYIEAKARRAD